MKIPEKFLRFPFANQIWKKVIKLYNFVNLFGRRFYCPVCGKAFFFFRNGEECRYCLSLSRQRKIAYYILTHKTDFRDLGKICEFAPNVGDFKLFFSRIDIKFDKYIYADLEPEKYPHLNVLKVDLQKDTLPIAAASVTTILIFDVLEHIPNDRKALENLFRILRTGGRVFATVPIDETLETTVEYGKPRPEESNHVRLYGGDIMRRAANAGFHVKKVKFPNSANNKELIAWMRLDMLPFFIFYKM